ncbi:MAG: hypothetical protein DMD35_21650, partial [Gemmatimonadetes bacterium]
MNRAVSASSPTPTSSYAVAPRIALVVGVTLATLPRLIAGTVPGDATWLAIGVVVALVVVGLTRFVASGAETPTTEVVGDAVALGALTLAY